MVTNLTIGIWDKNIDTYDYAADEIEPLTPPKETFTTPDAQKKDTF